MLNSSRKEQAQHFFRLLTPRSNTAPCWRCSASSSLGCVILQHPFCSKTRMLLNNAQAARVTLKHNTEDNHQRPKTAQSSTLFRLPKPILWIADVFHSGSGGTNCTAGGCCFNTPRGSVHSTASHLYMKVWVVERVLTAITSQPAERTQSR